MTVLVKLEMIHRVSACRRRQVYVRLCARLSPSSLDRIRSSQKTRPRLTINMETLTKTAISSVVSPWMAQ